MARYAPIGPTQLLRELRTQRILSGYCMVLAHEVATKYDTYKKILSGLEDRLVIMDNGVIELGAPASDAIIYQGITNIRPDIVVLPDMIGSADATLVLGKASIPRYKDWGANRFMFVLQGNSKQEITQCAIDASVLPDVFIWGIPRWMTNKFGSRAPILQMLDTHNDVAKKPIHLLGMSNNIMDDIACARWPSVMGIDSAAPLLIGQQERLLNIHDWVVHPGRGEFMSSTRSLTMQTVQNVHMINQLVGVKFHAPPVAKKD